MLSETSVLAFLGASITGAGLVLAVYTLFIPIAGRFFELRAKLMYESLSELKEKTSEKGVSISEKEIKELEDLLEDIRTLKSIPSYLTLGMYLSFFGYIASTLLAVGWILDFQNYRANYDQFLPFAFVCSTIVFFISGFWIIKELNETMKEEFEELKKKVEEARQEVKPRYTVT